MEQNPTISKMETTEIMHTNKKNVSTAQKTAVEWLLSELEIRLLKIKSEPDGIVRETMINNFLIDAEQTIAVEKAQHGKTWDAALDAYQSRGHLYIRAWSDFDEYYTETYNKEDDWGGLSNEELIGDDEIPKF